MNSESRACVAYIAASLCGARSSFVYDYSQAKYKNISGHAQSNNVSIYDHDRNCYISGLPTNLYDYGSKSYIQLNMNTSQFNGYDFATSNHFSGSVNGNVVSIYDYGSSSHYNYSV